MARDLKLQVILDAVDRATGPLKKITQGSGATAEALKASRDQLKTLERAQRELRGFRDLKRQSEDSARALTDQQREVQELTRQLEQADGATGDLTRRRAQAIRQAQRLKEQYQAEQQQLQYLRTHMTRVDGVTGKLGDQQQALSRRIRDANEQLQRQQQELGEVARKQRQAADAARQFHRGMGRAGRLMGTGAGGLATGGASLYGGARLLAPGVDYGAAMSRVQALTRLDKNDPRFQALQDQARELGSSTSFSATQAAEAQGFLGMAGFDPDAIIAAMPSMLDLAKAQGADLGRTADISSNLLSGFGLDPAEMTRLADVITATTTRANVDLEMLGESMKYVAPVAREMGLSLEESAAMAGLLGNVGIQGSQAGTTLRAMMLRLSAPTGAASDALATLGIHAKDAEGNLRNVPEILADVAKATETLGSADRLAYLKDIFGEEPAAGMAELINQQGAAGIEAFVATLDQAAGENARVAKVMADNIKGDLQGLNSAWEEVGITLTDTNEGPLRNLIQNVTRITRAVGDWMKANPELTAQLATAAAAVAGLVAVGGALTLALGSLLGPMVLTRYGLQMLGLKGGAFTRVLGTLAARAIPALIGALRMLGAAAMANPILAIIGLIAAGALLIWQNWDTLGPKFAALWEGIKTTAGDFWEWLKATAASARDLIIAGFTNWTLPGLILQHWDAIRASGTELWQWFQDAPGNAIEVVATMLSDWDLKGLLEEKWTAAMDYLKSLPGRMRDAGLDVARGLGEGIKNGAVSAWDAVSDAARGTEHRARYELDTHSPSRVFKSIGGDVMAGLAQGIQGSEQAPLSRVTAFSQRLRQAGAGLAVGAATLPTVATADIPIDTRPPLSAASADGGVVIQGGINISVQPAPGMDEQALARYVASEVRRTLDEARREAGARNRSAIYDLD